MPLQPLTVPLPFGLCLKECAGGMHRGIRKKESRGFTSVEDNPGASSQVGRTLSRASPPMFISRIRPHL